METNQFHPDSDLQRIYAQRFASNLEYRKSVWYVLIEKESKSKVDKLIIVALPFFIAGTNEMNILLMAWLLLYSCLKSNNKRIIYFSLITFAILEDKYFSISDFIKFEVSLRS